MRRIVGATTFILVGLLTSLAHGQAATDSQTPTKPRVFVLIAAVGDQFTETHEAQSTGSHLSPFRLSKSYVPNNLLNRVVLHSLGIASQK